MAGPEGDCLDVTLHLTFPHLPLAFDPLLFYKLPLALH